MRLCKHDCYPCCDFCKYVIHEKIDMGGKIIKGGPIGCDLHKDKEHQDIAEGLYYCDDFWCRNCDDGEAEGEGETQ